jgi:cupin fold WbuC family metalloprotein
MSYSPLSAKALDAPQSTTTIIGTNLVRQAIDGSRRSPRKRIILPLHKGPDSALHRMLNAVQPYSYIQPHRHLDPPKAESILVLQGAILCFVFSPTGEVLKVRVLAAGSDEFGVDSDPGVFHTFVALRQDTVLFEVKPGPYEKSSDKDFAPWAPPENSPAVKDYLTYLYGFAERFDCRIPQPDCTFPVEKQ